MRARHRHHHKLEGEAHRARGGGISHHPHNVVKGEGSAPKLHAGKRARGGKVKKRADGGGTDDWQSQPLRSSTGQYLSPSGPLASTGPAQFRNSMRSIGVQPTEYNKNKPGMASGGCVEDDGRKSGGGIHIKKSHEGLLHKDLGVAAEKKIPAKKLAKAEKSSDPAVKKRAVFAENAKHWHH